jgi:ATP-dependent exoDNAse (exonuclease V) beta subunit
MLYDGYDLQAEDIIYDLKDFKSENQKSIETTDERITYKQFDYKVEEIDERRFSKSEHTLFDDQTKSALAYGDEIHQSLEQINYLDLDQSMSNLPVHIQKSIKYLSQTDLFKSLNNPIFFKEYEFLDDIDGHMRSGIIDLLIEDDSNMIVIDYKLKNIDDEAYEKQINAYVNYLNKITDKQVKGYLYSLLNENLKQIV